MAFVSGNLPVRQINMTKKPSLLASFLLASITFAVSVVLISKIFHSYTELDDRIPVSAISDRTNKLLSNCMVCHDLTGAEHRIGPSLSGLIGRPAGKAHGFTYSKGMTKAHLIWDRDTLYKFLVNPQSVVPGTSMAISPLSGADASMIADYFAKGQAR